MKVNNYKLNNKEISIVYGNNDSIIVNIFNNEILMEIVGSFDKNLKELEKISGSQIYFRGNSITIKGKKNANEKVKDAIEYLIERFNLANKIERNDILSSFNKDIIEDMKNQSPVQPLDEVLKKPKKSVANPGTIKRIAAKAITAPEIISYAGTSFLTIAVKPDLKVFSPSYFA